MRNSRTSIVALAVAGLAPTGAMAAPVLTVGSTVSLNGGASATYGNGNAYNYGNGPDLFVSQYSSGSNAFVHAYSLDNGTLGTRSSGNGYYNISSPISFTNSFTAPNIAGNLIGTFHFDTIDVGAYANSTGAVSSAGSWGFSIKRDGQLYASLLIQAVASNDGDASNDKVTITSSGFDLSQLGLSSATETNGSAYISGTGGYVTIDLGAIAAGSPFGLEYLMQSAASGVSETYGCGGYGYGYGYGYGSNGAATDGLCYYSSASSIGRSGDPFQFVNDPLTFSVVPDDVPEPATLGVLALGLAGMGLARRRRR